MGCNQSPIPLSNCNPCVGCPPVPAELLPECEGGEPCEQVIEDKCVIYTGEAVVSLDIATGDRLDTVLAKILTALTA